MEAKYINNQNTEEDANNDILKLHGKTVDNKMTSKTQKLNL